MFGNNTKDEYDKYNNMMQDIESDHGQVTSVARCLIAIKAKESEFDARAVEEMTGVCSSTVYMALSIADSLDLCATYKYVKTDGRQRAIYTPESIDDYNTPE